MNALKFIQDSIEPTFQGLPAGGAVPVDQAILCPDCDVICTNNDGRCLCCRSSHVLNLADIINRTPLQTFILDVLQSLRGGSEEAA